MTAFSQLPLQAAIYQTLTGDTTLMALVKSIFDRAPQGSEFPYITIGDSVANDWSAKTFAGTEQMTTLHIWSQEGGHKETATIMDRIYQLLHDASLTVTGNTLIMIRLISSTVMLEMDGSTYHGTMRFRALLQADG